MKEKQMICVRRINTGEQGCQWAMKAGTGKVVGVNESCAKGAKQWFLDSDLLTANSPCGVCFLPKFHTFHTHPN